MFINSMSWRRCREITSIVSERTVGLYLQAKGNNNKKNTELEIEKFVEENR